MMDDSKNKTPAAGEDPLKTSIHDVREVMQRSLSGKQKDFLGGLISEIGKEHEAQDQPHPSRLEQLHRELDEQAVEFESDHPRLARAIRELMDTLHKMGL